MLEVSNDEFAKLVGEALDELPEKYVSRLLKHVVVTWEHEPTADQRRELKLRHGETLFGLYEGLPLSQRYVGGDKITPDKITIFRLPMLHYCHDMAELKEQIKKTVWHEMAHYFGLDHPRIHELGGS